MHKARLPCSVRLSLGLAAEVVALAMALAHFADGILHRSLGQELADRSLFEVRCFVFVAELGLVGGELNGIGLCNDPAPENLKLTMVLFGTFTSFVLAGGLVLHCKLGVVLEFVVREARGSGETREKEAGATNGKEN
jgi:hypothetical protein